MLIFPATESMTVRRYSSDLKPYVYAVIKYVSIAPPSTVGVVRSEPHRKSPWDIKGGMVMSTEAEVRKASKQFYAGLNRMVNGDADPLADIWSHSAAVTAMHPIGGRQVGWDAVRASSLDRSSLPASR